MCLSIILIDTTVHTPSDWTDWRGSRVYICMYIHISSICCFSPLCLCKCSGNTKKMRLNGSQADSEVLANVHCTYVCMYVYHVYHVYTLHTYVRTGFGRAYKLPSCLMVVAFLLLDATQVCHSKKHIHIHTHTDRGTQIHTGISA